MRVLLALALFVVAPAFAAETTFYTVIGVEESASTEGIKEAFTREARRLGAAVGGDEAGFQRLVDAYGVVGRPGLRNLYNGYLAKLRADRIECDVEKHRTIFRSYTRLILIEHGECDPDGFPHQAAFNVFLPTFERIGAKPAETPEPAAKTADKPSGCLGGMWKLGKWVAWIAVLATLLTAQGHNLGYDAAIPLPGTDPALNLPTNHVPEPPAVVAPPAGAPGADPASEAAKRRGARFAEQRP